MRHMLDAYRDPSEAGINLDSFVDPSEPWAVFEAIRRHRTACGRELFPARPRGYVAATVLLGHYAANKATAAACGLRGDMVAARNYETICQRIYERLPEFARW